MPHRNFCLLTDLEPFIFCPGYVSKWVPAEGVDRNRPVIVFVPRLPAQHDRLTHTQALDSILQTKT